MGKSASKAKEAIDEGRVDEFAAQVRGEGVIRLADGRPPPEPNDPEYIEGEEDGDTAGHKESLRGESEREGAAGAQDEFVAQEMYSPGSAGAEACMSVPEKRPLKETLRGDDETGVTGPNSEGLEVGSFSSGMAVAPGQSLQQRECQSVPEKRLLRETLRGDEETGVTGPNSEGLEVGSFSSGMAVAPGHSLQQRECQSVIEKRPLKETLRGEDETGIVGPNAEGLEVNGFSGGVAVAPGQPLQQKDRQMMMKPKTEKEGTEKEDADSANQEKPDQENMNQEKSPDTAGKVDQEDGVGTVATSKKPEADSKESNKAENKVPAVGATATSDQEVNNEANAKDKKAGDVKEDEDKDVKRAESGGKDEADLSIREDAVGGLKDSESRQSSVTLSDIAQLDHEDDTLSDPSLSPGAAHPTTTADLGEHKNDSPEGTEKGKDHKEGDKNEDQEAKEEDQMENVDLSATDGADEKEKENADSSATGGEDEKEKEPVKPMKEPIFVNHFKEFLDMFKLGKRSKSQTSTDSGGGSVDHPEDGEGEGKDEPSEKWSETEAEKRSLQSTENAVASMVGLHAHGGELYDQLAAGDTQALSSLSSKVKMLNQAQDNTEQELTPEGVGAEQGGLSAENAGYETAVMGAGPQGMFGGQSEDLKGRNEQGEVRSPGESPADREMGGGKGQDNKVGETPMTTAGGAMNDEFIPEQALLSAQALTTENLQMKSQDDAKKEGGEDQGKTVGPEGETGNAEDQPGGAPVAEGTERGQVQENEVGETAVLNAGGAIHDSLTSNQDMKSGDPKAKESKEDQGKGREEDSEKSVDADKKKQQDNKVGETTGIDADGIISEEFVLEPGSESDKHLTLNQNGTVLSKKGTKGNSEASKDGAAKAGNGKKSLIRQKSKDSQEKSKVGPTKKAAPQDKKAVNKSPFAGSKVGKEKEKGKSPMEKSKSEERPDEKIKPTSAGAVSAAAKGPRGKENEKGKSPFNKTKSQERPDKKMKTSSAGVVSAAAKDSLGKQPEKGKGNQLKKGSSTEKRNSEDTQKGVDTKDEEVKISATGIAVRNEGSGEEGLNATPMKIERTPSVEHVEEFLPGPTARVRALKLGAFGKMMPVDDEDDLDTPDKKSDKSNQGGSDGKEGGDKDPGEGKEGGQRGMSEEDEGVPPSPCDTSSLPRESISSLDDPASESNGEPRHDSENKMNDDSANCLSDDTSMDSGVMLGSPESPTDKGFTDGKQDGGDQKKMAEQLEQQVDKASATLSAVKDPEGEEAQLLSSDSLEGDQSVSEEGRWSREVSLDSQSTLGDNSLSREMSLDDPDYPAGLPRGGSFDQEDGVSEVVLSGSADLNLDDLGIIYDDWGAPSGPERSLESRQDERGIMMSDDEDDYEEEDSNDEVFHEEGRGDKRSRLTKQGSKDSTSSRDSHSSTTSRRTTKVRFSRNVTPAWRAMKKLSAECVPDSEGLEGRLGEASIKMTKLLQEAEAAHRADSPDVDGAQAKVTLQAYGLKIGDKVMVGGVKTGVLRFCGPTEFASGIWAGIELDEAAGKNDGSVGGVSYFKCSPKHGIFAPVTKISRPGILVNRGGNTPRRAVNYGHVDTSKVTAKVDTGLHRTRSARSAGSGGQGAGEDGLLEAGERVLVAGQRRGIIRFSGETDFAPGWWYGIELDRPVGKNDGSVNGKRYFTCKPKYGVFAPPSRIQKLSDLPDAGECLEAVAERQKRLASGAGSGSQPALSAPSSGATAKAKPGPPRQSGLLEPSHIPTPMRRLAPKSSGSAGSLRRPMPLTNTGGEFRLQEGTSVFCNNELGVIRYMGPVEFAEGIWLGVELRTSKGKNDGMVNGTRYFTCRANHGVLVRPSKVTVRGINGAKLMGNLENGEPDKKDTSY